jgi:hypothetical protein
VEFWGVDMDYENGMRYKKRVFAYAVRAVKETNKQTNKQTREWDEVRDVRYQSVNHSNEWDR